MPLMTVAEMVDDILNDMDSDPVTLFDDTEESRQVIQILKTTYFQIIDGKDWPHLYEMFQLTATGASTPTHMTIPSDVMDFEYIKYDKRLSGETRTKFSDVRYISPKEFLDLLDSRDSTASTVDVVTDGSGVPLNIKNDKSPTYWTSFDDNTVVFDSYDSAIDTTNLVASKTKCRGKVYPTWTDDDETFVPDLPVDAFSYYLSEAKSMCFLNIKQAANPKVEAQAVTQKRRMSQEAHKIDNSIKYNDYGRRGFK